MKFIIAAACWRVVSLRVMRQHFDRAGYEEWCASATMRRRAVPMPGALSLFSLPADLAAMRYGGAQGGAATSQSSNT
jgi:hypothetical protein